jgi:hypothetical protein
MTTIPRLDVPPARALAATRPEALGRYHTVTLLLSLWMIIGVFIDGWSHGQNKTESFFSPWHAVLYSGFLAVAFWMARPLVRGRAGESPWRRVPAGYAPGLLGVVMFAGGGIGDGVWHTAFGFERGMEILMSPPHFLLISGMALVVSSPFRAAWAAADGNRAPTLRVFLTPLLSLVLAVSVLMLIFFPFWGLGNAHFITPGAIERILREFVPAPDGRPRVLDVTQQRAIGNILITTWALMAPVLLMVKRWRPPFGAVTILFSGTTVLMASMTGFFYASLLAVPLIAGLAADVMIAVWWPLPSRVVVLRAFSALVPAVLWSLYFLSTHLQWGVVWGPALWLGVICWAAACGVGVGVLVLPSPGRDAGAAGDGGVA